MAAYNTSPKLALRSPKLALRISVTTSYVTCWTFIAAIDILVFCLLLFWFTYFYHYKYWFSCRIAKVTREKRIGLVKKTKVSLNKMGQCRLETSSDYISFPRLQPFSSLNTFILKMSHRNSCRVMIQLPFPAIQTQAHGGWSVIGCSLHISVVSLNLSKPSDNVQHVILCGFTGSASFTPVLSE